MTAPGCSSRSERALDAAAAHGLQLMVTRFPAGTRTAQDAAAAIGCPVGAIVKSLVFTIDGAPVDLAALEDLPDDARLGVGAIEDAGHAAQIDGQVRVVQRLGTVGAELDGAHVTDRSGRHREDEVAEDIATLCRNLVGLVHLDDQIRRAQHPLLRSLGRRGARALAPHRPSAVVWACTSGSFAFGWDGAHDQAARAGARRARTRADGAAGGHPVRPPSRRSTSTSSLRGSGVTADPAGPP